MTELLRFRRLAASDLEQVRTWRTNAEHTRFLLTDPQITPEQQAAWFERIGRTGESVYWIVSLAGEDIGYCHLDRFDAASRSADPGMLIGNPAFKGRGLGKSIMWRLQEHAFTRLGLNKLHGPVMEGNFAALASYMRSGWKIEGVLRQHVFKYDRFHDLILIALLRDDWERMRAAGEPPGVLAAEFSDEDS